MRFAAANSTNTGDYINAGKTVANSAASMFDKQRKTGPDYTGLSKVAMAAQTAERIAANEAAAKMTTSAIKARGNVQTAKVTADANIELGQQQTNIRKAGILPAIGKIVGSTFKKDPVPPPPRQQVAPVMPDYPDYPSGGIDRPTAPNAPTLDPLPNSSSAGGDSSSSSSSASSPVSPTNFSGDFQGAYKLALDAGFNPDESRIMAGIAGAESSYNPSARNPDASTGDNSYGLFQINMLGDMGPERRQLFGIDSNDQLLDPATNARAAKTIFDRQGFGAWSVYRSGRYQDFMQ